MQNQSNYQCKLVGKLQVSGIITSLILIMAGCGAYFKKIVSFQQGYLIEFLDWSLQAIRFPSATDTR